MTEKEQFRNIINFTYKCYKYQRSQPSTSLKSTLVNFRPPKHNFVHITLNDEYKDVGKYSFKPIKHPKTIEPCLSFPSFSYLGVIAVDYDEKVINEVAFKRVLLKIPSCIEDRTPEDLEVFIGKLLK